MAKKQSQSKGTRVTDTRETETQNAAAEAAAQEPNMADNQNGQAITLTLKRIQKNGIATYNQDGVNASVYFNKTMFTGEPPQTVQIVADGLTKPGESPVAGRQVDPAKMQERATKAQERAKKAQERAEKARVQAEKLAARAGIKSAEGATAGQAQA
jgi:hypothetical protein